MSISRRFNEEFLTDDDDNQENKSLNDFKYQLALKSCTRFEGESGCIRKHQPTKVNYMFQKKIKLLVVDHIHSVYMITEDGEQHIWNEIPALKHSDEDESDDESNVHICKISHHYTIYSCIEYTPSKMDLSNTRIVKTIYNTFNFLSLTDDGKLYYKIICDKRKRIHQIDMQEKITSMGCGRDFYVVVTNIGKIYTWGLNWDNLLYFTKEPREVTALSDKKIVKVATGSDYILALTDKGKVYGWGSNTIDRQLNLNKRKNYSSPIMVNIANVKKVSDIAALKTKSFVKCSEDGLVYILGYFAKTFIKKPLVCEYTNVFNVCDSMTAYSPISVTHEFTNDELDILNDLETAFNDRLTSDLAIEVEEQSIYVHKTILKMRCTYFRNMFQTDYIESKQSIIRHHYYSYIVYKTFLKYLYTNRIDLSSIDDLLELLQLTDEVCEKNLETDCIRTIKKAITASNIVYLINLIDKMTIEHHKKELEEYCFKFYLKNMTDVMRTESFKQLDDETKAVYITKGKEFFDI